MTSTASTTAAAAAAAAAPTPVDQLAIPLDPATIMRGDVVSMLDLKTHRGDADDDDETDKSIALKGRNTSGRTWKVRPQKRATSLVKTKVNNATKTWAERSADKLAKQEMRELQQELQDERRQSKIQKRERRLENERRRMENEYTQATKTAKSLNYNTAGLKLRAMSKKQLRQIKKTRVNPKTGVVEYVPLYQK